MIGSFFPREHSRTRIEHGARNGVPVTHCICWGTRPDTILQPIHDRALTIPALSCFSLSSGCEKGQQTAIATRRCEVRDA